MSDTKNQAQKDVFNIFGKKAKSSGLPEGIHERVRLINIDTEFRKDNNNNIIQKQLYLKFKKFNKSNEDIGEVEISFFITDSVKDSAVGNIFSFISQTREILAAYIPESEIKESFDPIGVLFTKEDDDERTDEEIEKDFKYDVIKKTYLKKSAHFKAVEEAVRNQFKEMLEDKIGFESDFVRLKLETPQDTTYVQIPRFERFIESSSVKKENSLLTNANK